MAEIIVTAQKRSQNLNHVGMSISAIGAEQLADRGVTRPEDLVRVVPSLTITKTQYDTYNDPAFSLRPYELIDLCLSVERDGGPGRVTFWGRKITNRYYDVSITRVQDTIARYAGAPATYGVTVGWKM